MACGNKQICLTNRSRKKSHCTPLHNNTLILKKLEVCTPVENNNLCVLHLLSRKTILDLSISLKSVKQIRRESVSK